MIYLTNGNMPLNAAYADAIVQEDNSTYQLSFRFPTSDSLWEQLKEETFLTADDLHGEQDFVIFEVEKKHGYIQVYANQVFTLLNNYVVNPISLDRQTGSTALSRFAGSITRDNPFSFFSDIEDRHSFNIGSKNAMEAFAKDKHSIIGQWGGDLVRHGYQVRLLKNGGSENESLFMYKKNLSSYQHKTSTKSLKTRITFIATVKGEGEKAPDRTFTVTIDSPLINKYSQIYEDVIEVNDQDVKDEASLRKYGEQYYRTSLCDMMEDSLEIEVVGQSDVPVQMFDVVSIFHEHYNLDVRKKITKYTYSPMAKKLKSIGFGQFQSGLANAIGNAVSDAVKGEAQQFQGNFERQLARELKNADLAFDRQKKELVNKFTDDVNAIKAKAEETKQEIFDSIGGTFESFKENLSNSVQVLTDKALEKAGASSLLAQEAKRIGLDSVAKLEEFKRQATSAQTALSGDLDVLKRTIVNDIRPKQAQAEAEIAKQVEALVQTKKELAGVKSAQATYEETTTRRLSELTNLANGKASKSELTQTAEELASKIASVRVGGVNLFKGSKDFSGSWVNLGNWTRESEKYQGMTVMSRVGTWFGISQAFETKKGEVYTLSFYIKSSIDRDRINVYFTHASTNQLARTSPYMSSVNISNEWQRTSVTFEITESGFILPRIERFNTEARVYVAGLKLERGNISTDYSESPEDTSAYISTVESNFIQRADALDAGVSRLTEGLRTKADISSLNVTAENIRQSVKSLETDTQNKLNQKLSTAEFDVRASGIRQEIVNATKDKADRALVTAESGKLRTELSTVQEYIEKDGQRQDALQRYAREESARQVNAVREQISRDYVGKATHQEDVRGIERRFEAITNPQNGTIATQIANYNQSVDGRFAGIISQIATKANQTDFQRVQETSKLYERIIGSNENDISNKVARMALTNQLFQVEVAKNASNGQNLLKGTRDFSGDWKNKSANWKKHAEKYKGVDVLFKNNSWNGIGQEIDTKIGEIYTFSLWMKSDLKNDTVNFYVNRNGSVEKGWGIPASTSVAITNEWKRYSFTFNITENGFIFPRVERLNQDTNLYVAGLKLEKGSYATLYTEAPEDTDEAIRSVQSQLAGSWAVQNINNAGDLISGINLGANGHNRFVGKLTHITGETLIDKAVIKSAMVDKLKTANFEAGSVTTVLLDAEAVTAEKLKVDQAFFNKLVANEAYLSQLFAKQAFITRVQSVTLDASQIKTGVLTGGRIHGGSITGSSIAGGTITGSSISGATLTGHTKIQLGTYGSFDTVDGGLQINVPRTSSSKDGLGVQFIGSYGRGANVPYGLYVYKDSDLTTSGTGLDSDDFLMTVNGYINAKGIGWLKTGKGSVNGQTTGTIGLWNSSNVSLAFGGPDNDIYYSYNGTAYGLWPIVNQHFSDKRLKKNIVDCEHKALDYIQQFQFKEYDWKKQEDRPQQAHTKIGLIAQEVQEVDPTLVYENGDTLNLDNLRLTNIALKAIQELALENQKLTHRLENLENEYRTA